MLPALEMISRDWLRCRHAQEKGFSVAAFEPSYLTAQSIALLRQNGVPVAFATGQAPEELPAEFGSALTLPKPFGFENFRKVIAALLAAGHR